MNPKQIFPSVQESKNEHQLALRDAQQAQEALSGAISTLTKFYEVRFFSGGRWKRGIWMARLHGTTDMEVFFLKEDKFSLEVKLEGF